MKRLILICGPMGVGKTSAGRELQKRLPNCAFLDGDWCWDIRPFTVTEETRAMVLQNIHHLLNALLRCTAVESAVFCWVMQEKEIMDAVLAGLELKGVEVFRFALLASEAELAGRIRADIARGARTPDALERSLNYLPKFAATDAERVDTSGRSAPEVAEEIARRLERRGAI